MPSLEEILETRIKVLQGRILTMRTYAYLKLDEADYHGGADSCMDLRDLESEILGVEFALKQYQEMKEKN